MPKSKTIEIDEIVTPEKSPGDDSSSRNRGTSGAGGASGFTHSGSAQSDHPGDSSNSASSGNPFADFQKALPWKARLMLKLTQWFMLLRSKSWGKIVMIPAIILALLLALPLGLLFVCFLIIRSFLKSFKH